MANFFSYFVLTVNTEGKYVLKNNILAGTLCSLLILISVIPGSDAEIWDLIVNVNVEKKAIYPGETVVVKGKIVDHSNNPVKGAEVNLRTSGDTIKIFTNSEGLFTGEFKNFQKIPGTYTINVIAVLEGKTGLTSVEFHVNGEISPIMILEEKLSTKEAIKYLNAEITDFEKNPIGQMLYNYYQKINQELQEEKEKPIRGLAEKIKMNQEREISEKLRQEAIEEFNPRAGTYQGYNYEEYINNLDPKIKDIVSDQLNFTKNTFEKAQQLRDEIIANGETYEEARKAYLEKISIPKEELEKFNQEKMNKEEQN